MARSVFSVFGMEQHSDLLAGAEFPTMLVDSYEAKLAPDEVRHELVDAVRGVRRGDVVAARFRFLDAQGNDCEKMLWLRVVARMHSNLGFLCSIQSANVSDWVERVRRQDLLGSGLLQPKAAYGPEDPAWSAEREAVEGESFEEFLAYTDTGEGQLHRGALVYVPAAAVEEVHPSTDPRRHRIVHPGMPSNVEVWRELTQPTPEIVVVGRFSSVALDFSARLGGAPAPSWYVVGHDDRDCVAAVLVDARVEDLDSVEIHWWSVREAEAATSGDDDGFDLVNDHHWTPRAWGQVAQEIAEGAIE